MNLYVKRLLFMSDGCQTDPYEDTKTAIHFIDPNGHVDSPDYPLTGW